MKKTSVVLVLIFSLLCASAAFAGPKHQLRLATTVTSPHPWYLAAEHMAERISDLTGGDVQVSIHGGGALGNENAIVNGMRLGSVDLMILSFTPLASVIPEGAVFSIPYIFSGYEHNAKAMDTNGEIFPLLSRYISDRNLGFSLLATGGGGARNILNKRAPIVVPSDMEGLKLRTVVNAMSRKVWGLVGAVPMAVPANEAYSALQIGICDSIEASLSLFNSSRLTELAPYLALSYHEFVVTNISISDITKNKLPKEYYDAVLVAAKEAGDLVTRLGIDTDIKTIDLIVERDGVKVNEIDREAFVKLFTPLQDELAQTLPGTDKGLELLNAIRAVDSE